MSAKGVDIASYFLRDRIYSNKVLACVREYICNAVDEHVKHNIKRPVAVKIEQKNDEFLWSVRDFAKGLDEHGIRNIFGMYFESTKSNTNTMIGGFGIGSKAAHCYTDTFYIKSHNNGVCTFYACVLGGGDKGVPIGEIYKIDESPSEETGIEISFNIKNSDLYSFRDTTTKFVETFGNPDIIEFETHSGDKITPLKAKDVRVVDGITYHLYDKNTNITSSVLSIRMGGVVYKTIHIENVNGYITADVPIGKLTIPISREHLESTQSNDTVIGNILNAIQDMKSKDTSSVPNLKMGEFLIKAYSSNSYYSKNVIDCGWFTLSIWECYPKQAKVYPLFKSFAFSHGTLIEPINGKVRVYVTHNPRTHANWVKRLYAHTNTNIIFIQEHIKNAHVDTCEDVDFSDIEFIDIRKAGIPAIVKNKPDPDKIVRYSVYRNGRTTSYSIQELEDIVTKETGYEVEKDWYKKANNMQSLISRTVAFKKTAGWNGTVVFSKTAFQELLKMGWISNLSQEYALKRSEIIKKQRELDAVADIESRIRRLFRIKINEKAVIRISKNPNLIERLTELNKKILEEDTVRARVLRIVQNSYSSESITRSDLRKILKLV